MSSFNNVGKREKVRVEKRTVKRHLKRMYSIMDTLDDLATVIYLSGEDWNEDNIAEVAAPHTDLVIENMEKFLLLGKLSNLKQGDESRNNSK